MIPSSAGFPHPSSIAASCLSIPSGVAQGQYPRQSLNPTVSHLQSLGRPGNGLASRRGCRPVDAARDAAGEQARASCSVCQALGKRRRAGQTRLPGCSPAHSPLCSSRLVSPLSACVCVFPLRISRPHSSRLASTLLTSRVFTSPASRLATCVFTHSRLASSLLASCVFTSPVSRLYSLRG